MDLYFNPYPKATENIDDLKDYIINSIGDSVERFAIRYDAMYCGSALDNAPENHQWDRYGFFKAMDRAKERGYTVDDDLIRDVGSTNLGRLYELRCYGEGWRIFFVSRKKSEKKVLIAGFYHKGGSAQSQNRAIREACNRVNKERTGELPDA